MRILIITPTLVIWSQHVWSSDFRRTRSPSWSHILGGKLSGKYFNGVHNIGAPWGSVRRQNTLSFPLRLDVSWVFVTLTPPICKHWLYVSNCEEDYKPYHVYPGLYLVIPHELLDMVADKDILKTGYQHGQHFSLSLSEILLLCGESPHQVEVVFFFAPHLSFLMIKLTLSEH